MNKPSSPPSTPKVPPVEVPEGLETVYANVVRIAHSPSELVLDFAHLMPGISPAHVRSRIVMAPLAAKLLYRALGENLARYEAAFGEIHIPVSTGSSGDTGSLADHLFRPPAPPDKPPSTDPKSPGE